MSSKPFLKKITSFLLAIAMAVMLISTSIPVQTVAAADHVCTCVGVVREYLGITAAIGSGSQTAAWFLKNGWVETRNPVKGDVVVMWPGYPGANSQVGHVGIFQDMSHLWQNKITGDVAATPPCSNAGSVAWRSFNMNSSLIKFYTKRPPPQPQPQLQPHIFINGVSRLWQDGNWLRLNLTITANNLSGQKICVHTTRPGRDFGETCQNATSNSITFYDLDSSGYMNSKTLYTTRAAMNQDPNLAWPVPCAAATGGKGLCDNLYRP